jgi:hypothetical protein
LEFAECLTCLALQRGCCDSCKLVIAVWLGKAGERNALELKTFTLFEKFCFVPNTAKYNMWVWGRLENMPFAGNLNRCMCGLDGLL